MEGSRHEPEWDRAADASQLASCRQALHDLLAVHSSIFHRRLHRDVRLLKRSVCAEEGFLDVAVLATGLVGVGYRRVQLRSALGGGAGADCFANLRNEFLVVADEAEGADYIVGPSFRDHFTIPCPTPRYAALLEGVPSEIVARREALAPAVRLLCGEMSAAFQAAGVALPPWRHERAVLSKWLPARAKDVEVASPSDSPKAGSAADAPFLRCGGADPPGSGGWSSATSGAITPAASCEGESPRAVLNRAAVVLISCPPLAGPRLPLKPRSLLSADLAVRPHRAAPGSKAQGKATSCSDRAAAPVAAEALVRLVGWQEPPIRRVRMQGTRTAALA
jgi:uncharacterized protein (TIGR01615 family)